jgi:hypothetical protein
LTWPRLFNLPCILLDGHAYCAACHLAIWLRKTASEQPNTHLFVLRGNPYDRGAIVATLKRMAARIGVDSKHVGGHSLRVGEATASATAGLDAEEIKALGRWMSEAYAQYVRLCPPSVGSWPADSPASRAAYPGTQVNHWLQAPVY